MSEHSYAEADFVGVLSLAMIVFLIIVPLFIAFAALTHH
jgi:hypothetical protein